MQLGIALAHTPRGRYKVCRAMVVAAPSTSPPVADMATPDRPLGHRAQKRTEEGVSLPRYSRSRSFRTLVATNEGGDPINVELTRCTPSRAPAGMAGRNAS